MISLDSHSFIQQSYQTSRTGLTGTEAVEGRPLVRRRENVVLNIGWRYFRAAYRCSFALLCPTLWDPMDYSTSGLPVHHQLLEPTQTNVHWVGDAIQSSHPLLSPSLPALNLSQHQGLCKWVSSSYQVSKVLELQPQHQSFQWIFRTDFL